jgi:hypothetical protein
VTEKAALRPAVAIDKAFPDAFVNPAQADPSPVTLSSTLRTIKFNFTDKMYPPERVRRYRTVLGDVKVPGQDDEKLFVRIEQWTRDREPKFGTELPYSSRAKTEKKDSTPTVAIVRPEPRSAFEVK